MNLTVTDRDTQRKGASIMEAEMAFNAFREGATNPSNGTTEPTAGEDVMCQNNLKTGDDFIIIDFKPTESLKADDNFLVIDWLAEDHFKVDPSDPSVDPNNPNVEWPIGPTPSVQDDGLLLPAVRMESGDGGFADGHNDGGIIVDYTPGPDDNVVELLGQSATETLTIAHEGFL